MQKTPLDRARGVARRVRRSVGGDGASAPQQPPRRLGVVERVNRKYIVGWVQVPSDLPPTPVTLHIGKIKLSSTYPSAETPLNAMAIARDVDTPEATPEAPRKRKKRDVAAGRRDRLRNAGRPGQEIRGFSFQIQEIWNFVRPRTRITVRFEGQALPIVGHGMFMQSTQRGKFTPDDLSIRMDEGYVLNQFGRITLSKRKDTAWQAKVIGLYERTRGVLKEQFGYEVFGIYGTLLGAVREGGYIGHDVDFDAAYISDKRTGPEAAEELVDIALALLESGLRVDLRHRVLHIHDPEDHASRIDLFHTFWDNADELRFPWGVAGETTLHKRDWKGTKGIDFPGGELQVPVNDEAFVAHIYGEDWRLPKPGFNWSLARTDVADDGVLTRAQRTKVYWADFYAHHEYDTGSTFCDFLAARDEMPQTVIDIGCGDGRDSRAFAAGGRTVLGLDQSPVGVEHANKRAEELGLAERAKFRVCDVSDVGAVSRELSAVARETEGPLGLYLRFFLHAINEPTQAGLLGAIRDQSRPGDVFTAEFRTDKDEANHKTHGNHYRRFQNAAQFRASLENDYGFEVLYDFEGTGLSPYGDEDPVLYRVIARRV